MRVLGLGRYAIDDRMSIVICCYLGIKGFGK